MCDNGSGSASLLELGRLLSTSNIIAGHNNTIVFVATDLGANGTQMGLTTFLNTWLIPYVAEGNGHPEINVVILDSIMNYEPFPTAQDSPVNFPSVTSYLSLLRQLFLNQRFLSKDFPSHYTQLDNASHMGNFLQLIVSNNRAESTLTKRFETAFEASLVEDVNVEHKWNVSRPWLMTIDKRQKVQETTSTTNHQMNDATITDRQQQQGLSIDTYTLTDTG